jgi:hypothetical protein
MTGKFTDIGPMSAIDQLLRVARRYAEIENIPLSTVSSRVFDDGKKLGALEDGADINVGRLERALLWFSERMPEGKWPSEIARPSISFEART